ncbi:MAG: aspartyl-tRNA synthetase [Parcubacteria group bacterium Greene1014_15]|nr:MAG: aspartyl-tRNA synthetase [Parcubacteria group bacterium Greene1014_15]
MTRIHIKELHPHINSEVTLAGWVDVHRDHGKLIFIDLRDVSGKVQMVALPFNKEAHEQAGTLRNEWVIEIRGKVNKRPEKMRNDKEPNGDIEIELLEVTVLNESKTPPFEINSDTSQVDENLRLKYRYLDLRSERMQHNIKLRSEFVHIAREYLRNQNFIEIETPLLTATTPEGSRDFVVPSRLNRGKFYALPQSPQQYKQLLMTAGFERYMQLARCIRDEDLRADRGFEFTQIDLEMSFVTPDDVMRMVEDMMIHTVEKMGFTIRQKPFPRITYKEVMEKYGTDKFDMRTDEEKERRVLAYAWVIEFPFFEKTDTGAWTFTHNPFSMPIPEHVDMLLKGESVANILTTQYDLVCNGYESAGGSIRAHRRDILEATYRIMGYTKEQTEKSVGHILEAFELGTPPHGGIALGVERNIMNLTGETALREVQAFPMTRGGQTAVMENAPGELTTEQLLELGISIIKQKPT